MSAFVAPGEYKQRLEQLLDDEYDLSLAIAFWGVGAVELISSRPGKRFRILCNLKLGGTNPYVIRELCILAESSDSHIQIRQCDRLHAKVVAGNRQALIGSANVSSNGLGFGDQSSAHWLEAGVFTSNEAVVGDARDWFDDLWQSSVVRVIEDKDIEVAIKIWEQNRHARQLPGDPQGEFDLRIFSAADLAGMPAYALLYREDASTEAKATAKEFGRLQLESVGSLPWWPFEGWTVNLSEDNDLDYLSIRYAKNGRVTVFGVCRMIGHRLPVMYKEESWAPGHIDMALPQDKLLNRPFGKEGRKRMAKQLAKLGRAIWNSAHGDNHVKRIHIADLARVLHEQSTR